MPHIDGRIKPFHLENWIAQQSLCDDAPISEGVEGLQVMIEGSMSKLAHPQMVTTLAD